MRFAQRKTSRGPTSFLPVRRAVIARATRPKARGVPAPPAFPSLVRIAASLRQPSNSTLNSQTVAWGFDTSSRTFVASATRRKGKLSGEPTENFGQNQHPSAPYQRGQRPRYPRITPRRPKPVRSQLNSADVRAIKIIARFRPIRIEPSREGVVRRHHGRGIKKPTAIVIDPGDQKNFRLKAKPAK